MSQGRIVNAASILGVLSLGIAHGAEVTLAATGSGADEVLASLANLLSIDMDAE
jgi:phosphocarrier protein